MISSMMFNAFFFIKKCVLTQQALIRVQVNARSIDYLLGKALRNSGALGCQRLHQNLIISADQGVTLMDYGLTHTQGIKGVLPTDLPKALGASKRILQRAVVQSDMLWLQTGAPFLQGTRVIKQGTLLVDGDCQRVTFYHWQEQGTYKPSATVKRVASTVYYVGKTKRNNEMGNPIYALYSTDVNGRTLELVEGVEKLVFTYGILKDGSIIYQSLQDVEDWYDVVSVRLNALLNSVEESDPILQKWWNFEWHLSK